MGAMAIVGCPSDDSDDGASGESGTDTGGSGSTTTTDGSPMSASVSDSESTGGSASATEGSTGIDPSTTSETGTVDDTGPDESESTGAADECVGLDRLMCMMNANCAPIACRPIVESNSGAMTYCTGDAEFVGCQAADIACAEVITVGCDGDDGAPFMCSNACLPDGWNACDPPTDGEIPMCEG
jgi:hypothetical protein